MSDQFAFIIGIENYLDSRMSSIPYAENDVLAFKAVLERHGFKPGHITLLLNQNATRSTIESKARSLFSSVLETDSVIVFYVGHGFSKGENHFLTCSDTQADDLESTAIPWHWLVPKQSSRCGRVVVFLDSSHSDLTGSESQEGAFPGAADDEFKQWVKDSALAAVFVSSAAGQYSKSSSQFKHGIWTYHLLKALQGEAKEARNKKGQITSESLQNYLSSAIPQSLRKTLAGVLQQTPRLFGNTSSELIIADCSKILEEKRAYEKPNLARLKNVIFSGEESGSVKTLKGFQKHHSMPEVVNHATESFLNSISQEELEEFGQHFFKGLRDSFGYKRKEIELTEETEGTSIITIDFTLNLSIALAPEDATRYRLRFEVEEIQNFDAVDSPAFNTVFKETFNSLSVLYNQFFNIEELVDAIEGIEDRELISVDYPGDLSSCTIQIEGLSSKIRVMANTFRIIYDYKVEPKVLIDDLAQAQQILVEAHQIKSLSIS